MRITTRLNQDQYGWMAENLGSHDDAYVLVDVEAPALPTREDALPTRLVVVLDRSGSMSGARLDHAKRALRQVVEALSPSDSFGLVTFDQHVEVAVNAGPVTDPAAVLRAVDAVRPGGSTDLAGGLIEGLRQATLLDGDARVLLISDGHANQGVVDPDALQTFTARHLDRGVTTSTLGMGLGYDETLLGAVSRGGTGEQHFAEEADTAVGAITAECGDLAAQRFLQCRLTIVPGSSMAGLQVVNDVAVHAAGDGSQVTIGGLRPGDSRSLVLQVSPHTVSRPGRRKVAKVHLDWVFADDLTEHSASTSVWARVARPGDPHPQVDRDVTAEVVLQRALRRKRAAVAAMQAGDTDEVGRIVANISRFLSRWQELIPRNRWDELLDVDRSAQRLWQQARDGAWEDQSRIAKLEVMGSARMSRNRDRNRPTPPSRDRGTS
ncbi:von Willebrand factor type A domain protein [Aeromicrobium marinum DSM 15272]|uniref:von Willebrand factor type A domain protein n=1 Tax=Aeromicrobium marinum DSM 15272 TaxID=585531 RepID=E2SAI8_9ACTN|nr:VWA domain-containing protein [Aeromicrobium marinum]EFQ84262.1 von Willebrand factor type A domain protein [Aeromicrobium marinum DSM 15272]